MLRPAVIVLLAILGPACSLMPAKSEHVRARQMEDAVLPMAATALEAGQVETARRLYVRLLDVDPESVQARMGLGDVALRERETAAAARWYLAAVAHAEAPAERHAALLAHGRAALAAGQLEAAGESFTRLTEPNANAPRESVAWGHNGMGLTLLLEGDLRGAVAAMEQAVLRAPEEERFQGNLNRALALLEEYPSPEPSEPAVLPFAVPTPGSESAESANPPQKIEDAPANALEGNAESAHGDHEPGAAALAAADLPASEVNSTVEAELEETEDPIQETEDPVQKTVDPVQETERSPQQPDDLEVSELESAAVPDSDTATEVEATEVPEDVADGQAEVPAAESAGQAIAPGFDERGRPAAGEDAPDATTTSSPLPRVFVVTEDRLSFLQFGAYAKPANADAVAAQLRGLTERPVQISNTVDKAGTALHRVRIGPVPSVDALEDLISVLEARGYRIANPPRPSSDGASRPAPAKRPLHTLLIHEDGKLFLQAGAYSELSNAESAAAELRGLTDRPVRISEVARADRPPLHRVRIGPLEADDPLIARFEPGE